MASPPLTMRRARILCSLAGWLAAVPVAAQSTPQDAVRVQGTQEEAWTLPRTAWGDPDLRGTWSYASLTPLQRPANFRDKDFFSDEEAVARNEAAHAERPHVPGSSAPTTRTGSTRVGSTPVHGPR